MNAVAGVVAFIGLASFGALAWMARMALERPLDIGAIVVLAVFALFGTFCMYIAWRVFRTKEEPRAQPQPAESSAGPRRVTLSHACSTIGVLLLILSAVLPETFYPVVLLFVGIAFLAVAHVLTPCEERLEKLRKARASIRQL